MQLQSSALLSPWGGSSRLSRVGTVVLGWLGVACVVRVAGLAMGRVAWLLAWRGHGQEPGRLQPL